jgi:lytic murein transglycosylase
MEADFEEPGQTRDVLRSLATLAYARPQTPTFKTEFIAALAMLGRRLATRGQLRGSWAGAMGMPQFMPSAYLKYALRYSGHGPADIWSSVPDSLASIANFLNKSGWRRGLPWGFEVELPPAFGWRSLHADFAAWRDLGLGRADGLSFPARGEAALFAPAGAAGPAFLLSANYWILKQYNNSDSYALSLALLADRIAGGPGVRKPWPDHVRMLSRADRIRLQRSLAALGFYRGLTDGKIGPATRDAVHEFQVKAGLQPADGLAAPDVLAELERQRGGR